MEVLIIGAGVAGLAAAHALVAAGVKTQIIEARDRIGGRIWTVRSGKPAAPVELGAEFIHGKPRELLDIAKAAGLSPLPMSAKHAYVSAAKPVNGGELFAKAEQIFERLGNPELLDQSFSDFLSHMDVNPEVRSMALNYVEGFNAARADLISTRSLAFESQAQDAIGGDQAFRLEEGYDRLPQWLWSECASNAQLTLSTVVEKIEWRRGHVTVTARSGTGESVIVGADRAIITLPLGVLKLPEAKREAVRFRPRPAVLDGALDRLAMGQAVRVTLELGSSLWQDHPQLSDAGFVHTDSDVFPTWWTTLPGSCRGLTAWAGGPKAEKVLSLTDEQIAGRAVDSLAHVFAVRREAVAGQVEGWHLHNWSSDPFARGAYSYARVGGLEARERLAQPAEDTLYFAGEATDTEGHSATVHGALASGLRAARQILAGG